MLTLTNGYKKPETGDRGSVWFPAMEDNMQRLNDHNHDGVNSEQLDGTALASGTVSVLAANWVATGGQPGTFEQTVTLPAGFDYDDHYTYGFKINGGANNGALLTLSYNRISNTQVKVFINDSSLDLTLFAR